MRPSSSPRRRRPVAGLVLVLGVALAGCLPTAVRPTPSPPGAPTAAPTASRTPGPPTPTPGPPTPTPGPTFALHRVVPGDTLTSLARRFHTSGRSLAYWNRDRYPSLDPESAGYKPDKLDIGWVLRVIPGHEYVPPPDDGETGVQVTPTPDDGGDGWGDTSTSPAPSAREAPSASG